MTVFCVSFVSFPSWTQEPWDLGDWVYDCGLWAPTDRVSAVCRVEKERHNTKYNGRCAGRVEDKDAHR